jgi:hypothetical protein
MSFALKEEISAAGVPQPVRFFEENGSEVVR